MLNDIKDHGCPLLYNADTKQCSYPSRLELDLDSDRGSFSQAWSVFSESIVYLPGDQEHWPQHVSVDGHPVAVVSSAGRPSVTLE